MISVLILTFNEEQNIATCLQSVNWCDDIVVFDSFSTDRTVEIARSMGARVIQHKFTGYGAQREAARQLGQYRHPWVLALDADETPDQKLVEEMLAIAEDDKSPHAAYRMRRKDFFMGRWIKHATLYPSWFFRFYRHADIAYEPRVVHEYPRVNGSIGELQGHLLHNNFSKGLAEWVGKHARYAELEAVEDLASLAQDSVDWAGVVSRDPIRRRKSLKTLSFRLPFRPLLRFLYMYFVRLSFVDGTAGFHYCRLLAIYEYLIVLNMREIQMKKLHGAQRISSEK